MLINVMLGRCSLLGSVMKRGYYMLAQRSIWRHTAAYNNTGSTSPLKKNLKDEAGTVVIGGGIVGCSLAYHLAKQGEKDVILLEKTDLTAGSTWHAAGLTTLYHPSPNLKLMHYYSINWYAQLEAETGQEIGFHRCGSLRVATAPVRIDEMKYSMSRHRDKPTPQRIVSVEEVKKLAPIVNTDIVLGGLFNPYDGYVDPYSLTHAMAIGARKHGATLYTNSEVTGLKHREDGRWEVDTPHGTVVAGRVVNAAGFWAKEIGRMSGLDLPLVPIHHQYVISASVPEVEAMEQEMPVLRHLEGSFYMRQEHNGLLVGPYESMDTMKLCDDWVKDQVPPGFGRELFEPDVDRLMPHLTAAMELVPCMEHASIQSVVNGPITYAPDLLPMIGPSMIPNMWLSVGLGYGIIHAGGAGKYLTDWIQTGEPPREMSETDACRFNSNWATTDFSLAKARESYGMNNAVGYPNEERFRGRPTCRVTTAHDMMVDRGAFMSFHSGWESPAWFAGPGKKAEYAPSFRRTNWHDCVGDECRLVMNDVGVIDLSSFAKLEVSGRDARRFLDYTTANAVPKPGRTCISHCLTSRGRVYAELTITCVADDKFFIITGSGSELHDLRWLQKIAREGRYDVTFANKSDDVNCLGVAGPKSRDLLNKLAPQKFDKFPFLSAREVEVAGIKVHALRISYTGELGWELYCDASDTKRLYENLLNAGQDFGVGDFGSHALNVLRIEKGFRMWGKEMNMDNDPLEAGLDYFIKVDKGEFLGRSAIQQIQQDFPSKQLVMLSVDSPHVDPFGDEAVRSSGRIVGYITSGCFSHTTNQVLSFAYVPPFINVPGTKVEVELLGELREAKVLSGPPLETQPIRDRKARKAARAQ